MGNYPNFAEDVRQSPTAELQLILLDQAELYTEEELEAIRNELSRRNAPASGVDRDSIISAALNSQLGEEMRQQQSQAENAKKAAKAREEAAKAEARAKREARIRRLRDAGAEGYWEYTVLSLLDEDGGAISPGRLQESMNHLGLDGWKLCCAYANELGRNAHSSTAFGVSRQTNATIDQNILIFERFVRI